MSIIDLPDELHRTIEQQIANGQAVSTAAFLEEAVLRLIDEARAEKEELREAVEAGTADIEAGRYVVIATPEDSRRLHDRIMARLRARLGIDE